MKRLALAHPALAQLALGLMLMLAGASGAATQSACARTIPATIVTPQGKVAYQIEDLVAAIGTIQHAAINANHAGKVSRPVALKVTRSTRAIAKTLDAAIDAGTGTAAVYKDVAAALAELFKDPDLKAFQSEIAAAQVVVAALAGGSK